MGTLVPIESAAELLSTVDTDSKVQRPAPSRISLERNSNTPAPTPSRILSSGSLGRRFRMSRLDPVTWRDKILNSFVFPIIFHDMNGVEILSERWDNLILLDACRFDAFKAAIQNRPLGGTLESKTSLGTDTPSFLRKNFRGKFYDDIVYVTANPQVDKCLKGHFHKIVQVWRTDWDLETRTVLPEAVVRRAAEASSNYPDKRLIIHFMQPHFPYLGLRTIGKIWGFSFGLGIKAYPAYGGLWYGLFRDLGYRSLRNYYLMGLTRALDAVANLLPLLPGRTIITADHGEAFGEHIHRFIPIGVMKHPPGVRIRELVTVPWYSIEGGAVEVKAPPPSAPSATEHDYDMKLIRDRLRDLGYE